MYRVDWKKFKAIYSYAFPGYSTLEIPSGIHQFFQTRKAMIDTMARSFEPPKELLHGLNIYYGRPVVAINKRAAKTLRGRRAKGKYQDIEVYGDDNGAIVVLGTRVTVDPVEIEKRRTEIEIEHERQNDGVASEGDGGMGDTVSGRPEHAGAVQGDQGTNDNPSNG